jgi:nucleoside-diphosphate-sugar epimerase
VKTVAVTGIAGYVGQRLLRDLDADDGITRVIGLDIRDPQARPRKLEFHRVDIAGADLKPLLEGADTLVHLAWVLDPIPDDALMVRVNVQGTRRVLDAAGAAGVRKVVLMSSAAVYGAWPANQVPLTEDATLRPNPGFPLGVHKAEVERLLAEWRGEHPSVQTIVLRPAFVLGPHADHVVARLLRHRLPVGIAGAGAPVQYVHEDDVAAAIALAVDRDLDGVYNVAADGALEPEQVRALVGPTVRLGLPFELVERVVRRLWRAGLADVPPGMLPYLVHPWVVANDRLKAAGWTPRHTNEETLLACLEGPAWERRQPPRRPPVVLMAAAGSGVLAAGALAIRRRRRARARRVLLH